MLKSLFIFLFSSLFLSSASEAFNPHQRLNIAYQTEVAQVSLGQEIINKTERLRGTKLPLFYCLDSSCDEEFIYGQYENLYSINGQFFSAPNAYLGWLVYESLERSYLDSITKERFGVEAPRILERELYISSLSAQYLLAREEELGAFQRGDDYYNSSRFDYANNRGYGLFVLIESYLTSKHSLKEHLFERADLTGQELVDADTLIEANPDSLEARAALFLKQLVDREL